MWFLRPVRSWWAQNKFFGHKRNHKNIFCQRNVKSLICLNETSLCKDLLSTKQNHETLTSLCQLSYNYKILGSVYAFMFCWQREKSRLGKYCHNSHLNWPFLSFYILILFVTSLFVSCDDNLLLTELKLQYMKSNKKVQIVKSFYDVDMTCFLQTSWESKNTKFWQLPKYGITTCPFV